MADDKGRSRSELDRLRATVLGDGVLQDELGAADRLEDFCAAARARGFEIDDATVRLVLRDDPLGLSRWSDAPPSSAIPQAGWLPVHVVAAQGQLCVDWAYFGARSLTEPFFEGSARRALRLPLNLLARHRTRLADLGPCAASRASLPPSGFIFHMSRCGSTLAAQMLARDPRHIVISEAAPIDAAVRLDFGTGPGAQDAHAAMLRAMVGVFGAARTPAQARYFVKLDSWHALALPLFRRAFPAVPWVFQYREPAEVLASQSIERGIQTVPSYLPPALFGLGDADTLPPDDYCARVLSRTCEAVLEPYAQGGGLLVNYRDMPSALWSKILPHFGIVADAEEQARMADAARYDAKTPGTAFVAGAKQQALTEARRAVADRHMGAVYRRLEQARMAGAG